MIATYKEATEPRVSSGKVITLKIYGRHHDLVHRNGSHNPCSWLITGYITYVTWWVPLVKQKLLTLSGHMSSPLGLVGFTLLNLSVFWLVFWGPFFTIVLSELRFTVPDTLWYPKTFTSRI